MPIYEYECDACGLRFERKQGFLEDPIRVCPHCKGGVRRIIHPAGIVFKANGFYVTDNRPQSRKDGEEGKSAETTAKTDKAAATSPAADKD
jgi:putative FmdB family regulatory protein